MLGVPMLREGEPVGVARGVRNEVRPFSGRDVRCSQTFADQAVIAIENVRLFKEIQDKSRQLESREPAQVANSSPTCRTSCARR